MYEEIADFYDSEFRNWNEDLHFYLKLLAPHSNILELGPGTGRLAIALAQNGHSVTGIELSRPMIETGRKAVSKLSFEIQRNIKFLEGDFTRLGNFGFQKKFDAVIAPFSAFNFVPDASKHADFFKDLARRIKPEGLLIADIVFEKQGKNPDTRTADKSFSHCERGTLVKKHSEETRERGSRVVTVKQTYEERDYLSGKLIGTRENSIRIYLFEPDEIITKLETADFEIIEIFGNYNGAEFDLEKSPRMLVTATSVASSKGGSASGGSSSE